MMIFFICVVGVLVLAALFIFLRWFVMRPRTARLPRELIDQLNIYEEEFQRFNANVVELDNLLKGKARHQWQSRNSKILRTLRKISRLLQKLNDFYEELTLSQYRAGLRQKLDRISRDEKTNVFLTREEKERFKKLGEMTDEELENVNWDDILKRL